MLCSLLYNYLYEPSNIHWRGWCDRARRWISRIRTVRSGTGNPGNEEPSGGTVLKSGTFAGKADHECSGTVELVEDADGLFLQFREYQQTQGPDVFCYLTPAEDPDTSEEIDAGTKVLIDDGADGGEITTVGTFSQRLPNGLKIADLSGVGIWCENFSVPFGAATLSRV
ncbi:DM13 domain-containing protein [Halocatena marina]|uniref:DM13 domain-containing protein n=1 Tax=Halocatena marina TaxID=2934937 RepID=UPI003622EC67